ncbi:penicillin-binding protein 2A [Amphibacillus marinus]|uniref:Penicillin-binding protein 2A n=1 Tax=Amphibacillus marinus TaxID=872970 RepID=A0A1H8RW35_9BACI|nr:PBP1A family penicillin-binding protein [Amphibacillus marinus]SEO70153.1 penicillin-binding protein 2A [Amphibacillus marinus]
MKLTKWLSGVKQPWLLWVLLVSGAILLLSISGFLFILYGGGLIVDQQQLVLPATTTVVTTAGDPAGKLYTENRSLVSINQVPEHVRQAFIAVEDERFYEHAGVDFRSVGRAVYRDLIAFSKVEGASTITQQLAKNLFLDHSRSWMRKTQEVMASIYLERHYSKNEILELYLNQVYFAHGIYGIGTAADYFFAKSVEDLSIAEGALLAGMVKGPNLYSPYLNQENALARRNLVLSQMHRVGQIETDELLSLQGQTVRLADQQITDPWLDDYLEVVIREAEERYQISRRELQRGGYKLTVYMDATIQEYAYQEIQNDSYFSGSADNVETSFVLLEQEAGQLRAIIGGRNYSIGDQHRALTAKQPGSVIKPLAVYGPALSEDYSPYMLVDDSERDFDGYSVSNADQQYEGEVTMQHAVTVSKNTSAVWLLDQIGIDTGKSYLKNMQIDLSDQGLAIALGGLTDGLSPIQVAEGYRTFIHSGEWIESQSIAQIEDRYGNIVTEVAQKHQDVFTPQAAWYMLRMLENVVVEGTGRAGDFSKALAGKTGTTQHPQAAGYAKDTWFAGVTPEYVTALWIGYDQADGDHYLTQGSQAPTELTKAILSRVDQQQGLADAFTLPDGLAELEDPIQLPIIDDLAVSYRFGGWPVVQGELTWTQAIDNRVVYYVYRVGENGEADALLGQIEGIGRFRLNRPTFFSQSRYYVIPYNRLTDQYGERSNIVSQSIHD